MQLYISQVQFLLNKFEITSGIHLSRGQKFLLLLIAMEIPKNG
jgi:hypothetical protein